MKKVIGGKLYLKYYQGEGNYGDQINLVVWDKHISKVELREKATLYGIGTLLRSSNVEDGKKVIFGSGVGYGDPPEITDEWVPYCVRGPKTASRLGISQEYAVTDPGILIADFIERKENRSGVAFFPHESSLRRIPWKKYCNWLGLKFISPRWSVERVSRLIAGADIVVTEAMHGAITADALRVPWIPIMMNDEILKFKWKDWCASMNLEYNPVILGRVDLNSRFGRIKWRTKAPIMLAKVSNNYDKYEKRLSKKTTMKSKMEEIKKRMKMMSYDIGRGILKGYQGG